MRLVRLPTCSLPSKLYLNCPGTGCTSISGGAMQPHGVIIFYLGLSRQPRYSNPAICVCIVNARALLPLTAGMNIPLGVNIFLFWAQSTAKTLIPISALSISLRRPQYRALRHLVALLSLSDCIQLCSTQQFGSGFWGMLACLR